MNDPFEDIPPLFNSSDLTRYIEKTFQLLNEMKQLGRPPPPPGRVKPILQRLRRYQESRLINSSALKFLMQRLTEHVE